MSTIIFAIVYNNALFLCQVNTLQQLENIVSHEFIQERVVSDKVRLSAMWFDIYTGDFYMFSRERETFVEVTNANYAHLVADAECWWLFHEMKHPGRFRREIILYCTI